MKSRLDDASACRRIADSRSRDQRRSQTALCLLKKTKDMHRAHGAPDSQRDEPVEEDAEFHNFITLATMESLDVDKFNHHLTHMFLYDTKERIRAFTDAPKVLYITMEDYFRAATNHPPVTPEQDSQRDQFGNSKEDLITCAIIESLDVGTFTCIVQCTTKNELLDITGRIDAFGDSPGVLYSSMKKHFAQRARAAQNAAEAGARAGSGAAKAAETLREIQRHLEEMQAQQSKKVEHESKRRVAPHGAPRRVAPHTARHLAKNKTGAETLELARRRVLAIEAKTKSRVPKMVYHSNPHSLKTCKPSEALKSKLAPILQELIDRDEGYCRRKIGQMLENDAKMDEDGDRSEFVATAASEYSGWRASEKHEKAFNAFCMEMFQSLKPKRISDSEEEPIGRPRREQTTPDSLAAEPTPLRRLVQADSSDDDASEDDDDA